MNVQKMQMLGATVVPVTSGNMTLKDATNEAIRDWCCHPADTYYIIGSTVGPHPYPRYGGAPAIHHQPRNQTAVDGERGARLSGLSDCLRRRGEQCRRNRLPLPGRHARPHRPGRSRRHGRRQRTDSRHHQSGGKRASSTAHAPSSSKTKTAKSKSPTPSLPDWITRALARFTPISPRPHRATVLPINDDEALRAAFELTRLEGIIPALESAHALGTLPKLSFRPEDIVVLTVSGRGDKDMDTYLIHNGELKIEK